MLGEDGPLLEGRRAAGADELPLPRVDREVPRQPPPGRERPLALAALPRLEHAARGGVLGELEEVGAGL